MDIFDHFVKLVRSLAGHASSPVIQETARAILEEVAPEPVAKVVEEAATVADEALELASGTTEEASVPTDTTAPAEVPAIPELPPVPVEPVPAVELVPAVDPRDAEIESLKTQLATVIEHLNALHAAAPSDATDTVSQ